MSRLRQDCRAQAAYAAAVQALVDAGVTVIDRRGHRDGPVTLDHLVDRDGDVLTDEGHASCPGHAAVIYEHDPEQVTYYCVDPGANGHSDRWTTTPATSPSRAPTVVDGKMSEAAKAAGAR